MKLSDYIREVAKTKYYLWADKNGYCSASVYAWSKGKRTPNLSNLQKIMKDTHGMVGPGDFEQEEA